MSEAAREMVPTEPEERVPALAHLTQAEAEFVYNVEVLGLPVKKAADLAGVSMHMVTKPHMSEARKITRAEIRGQAQFTREDVLAGIHDAVQRARLIAEPATEIKGWEAIARIAGLEETRKLDINLRETTEVIHSTVRQMSDEDLIKMLPEAGRVIDAEFYPVKKDG